MNYIKVQKKILDEFLKCTRFICEKVDDYFLISANGFQIFKIPESEMYLDVNKMMTGRSVASVSQFVKKYSEGEKGLLTDEMRIDEKKRTLIKVASENKKAWVDKKLLDGFEVKYDKLHFTVSAETNPLIVWEEETMCGLICPVRVKGD